MLSDAFVGAADVVEKGAPAQGDEAEGSLTAIHPLGGVLPFDAGEAALLDEITRFPDRPQPLIGFARLAEERKDWPEALRRWALVRERLPERGEGYSGSASALLALERPAEAEAIWAEAVTRLPEWQYALWSHALSAHRREDWAEAGARWDLMRRRFPGEMNGFTFGAVALVQLQRRQEAEVLLTDAITRFPDRPHPLVEFARIAEQRKDWPEALRRWTALRETHPSSADGYQGTAVALQAMERPDEAEAIWAEAVARLPEWLHALWSHALIAHRRQDWREAVARWEIMRTRFPGEVAGFTFGAAALSELQRHDDAEGLLHAAVASFPDRPEPQINLARLAAQRLDWPEALRRWTTVRDNFPDRREGYEGIAWALDAMKRPAESEPLWAEAVVRFPDSYQPPKSHAFIAHHRQDWPEAVTRWGLMRARFPNDLVGYTFGAHALAQEQRQDEAEALLSEAISRFPDRPQPLGEFARLAQQRRDWPEALQRWTAMGQRFPNEVVAYVGSQQTLVELGRLEEAERVAGEAVSRFPGDGRVVLEAARLAGRAGDFAVALSRFEDARRLLPGDGGIAAEVEAVKQQQIAAAAATSDGVEAPSDAPMDSDRVGRTEPAAAPQRGLEPPAAPARPAPAAKATGGWLARFLGIGS